MNVYQPPVFLLSQAICDIVPACNEVSRSLSPTHSISDRRNVMTKTIVVSHQNGILEIDAL